MSTIKIRVANEVSAAVSNINVTAELYIEYVNTASDSKTITSRTLAEVNANSDAKGEVTFKSDAIANTKEFTRYWALFIKNHRGDNSLKAGTFKIKANTVTTDPAGNFVTGLTTVEFDLSSAKVSEPGSDGFYDLPALLTKTVITMIAKTSSKMDLDKLEKTFLEKETAYLQAKRLYESNIKILDTTKIFEQLNTYEPESWNKAISRLLEFEESTLDAALRFTKKTNLTAEFGYLDQIKTAITNFKNLYSSISLSDGEGIPYKPS